MAGTASAQAIAGRRAVVAGALLFIFIVGAVLTGGVISDYDGDGFADSLAVAGVGIHLFSTRDDTPDEARPVGVHWDLVLREALLRNDFVFDFLHRDDPVEVQTVRAAAQKIVGDAVTDRQKVESLLAWLSANWNFKVEHGEVNAAFLLEKREGMCETSGFVVGVLDTLGIKAREVNVATPGLALDIAVEVWLEGHWRVVDVFGSRGIDERSLVEMLPGRETEACIVYYWRDLNGKLLRAKLWYDPQVAPIFVTAHGMSPRELPALAQLRLSY